MFIVKLYAVHCTIGYYRIFYQKTLIAIKLQKSDLLYGKTLQILYKDQREPGE